MFHLLAAAATAVANPKEEAMNAAAPNAVFEPFKGLPTLTVLFFIASAIMIWLIIRAGKNHDYGS